MRILKLAIAITAIPMLAFAGGADGVWKTEADKDGAYIEVTVAPCGSGKTCGKITSAFNAQGADPNYENLGKQIIADMVSSDDVNYSDGTVWDPENGKTYKSKMILKGNELDVKGCVGPICSGQEWTRVK